MRHAGAVALLAAALAAACSRPPRQVVFVTIDTLRADHVGARRGGVALTPSLDRLAPEAVRYQDAIANASVTLTSHASFFSGAYPWRHEVVSNKSRLAEHVPWLPSLLRERGFLTAAVVSSAAVLAKPTGLGRGFASYDDRLEGREAHRRRLVVRTPARTTDLAVEWLRAHARESFFLWVHYLPPHGPYLPPAEFLEGLPAEREGRSLPISASSRERGAIPDYQALKAEQDPAAYRRSYAGHVRYADHHVGRLLDALRELGVYERALVVVTSDHGESLGEHDFYFCHGNLAYQEQLSIPLLIKRPHGRDAGKLVGQPVQGVDLAPTVLAELGLGGALETDGRSILPEAFQGKDARPRLAQSQNLWQVAAFEGPMKLILPLVRRNAIETDPGARVLFDLRNDPLETRDVSAQHLEQADRMEAALRRLFAGGGGAEGPVDREREEALKALGYVD